ncbi:helix-turn-helix domain-containing protein [Liberiplasma polymorphum]|uniref:helix-turn-helix domain-containing protein n=1 Tax=Liberiplasma polymorphum TaxID=3374570 RepID=UPI00377437F0
MLLIAPRYGYFHIGGGNMSNKKRYQEDYKNELGLRIYKLRTDKQLSILDFAVLLDVDPRTVSYYESGERGITVERLLSICNILDVSIESLLSN